MPHGRPRGDHNVGAVLLSLPDSTFRGTKACGCHVYSGAFEWTGGRKGVHRTRPVSLYMHVSVCVHTAHSSGHLQRTGSLRVSEVNVASGNWLASLPNNKCTQDAVCMIILVY